VVSIERPARGRELELLTRATETLLLAAQDPQVVLATALDLLGAHFGYGLRYLLLYDKVTDEFVFADAAGPGSERPEVRAFRTKSGRGLTGIAAETGAIVNVGDVRRDPRYLSVIPDCVSEICVPLLVRGDRLGVLVVQSPEPNAFSALDEELLTAFCHVAALALIHARADREQRARLLEAGVLHEVARQLTEATTTEDILHRVLDATMRLTDAEAGLIWRIEGDGFRLATVRNLDAEQVAAHPPDAEASMSRLILATGHPIRLADVQTEARPSWQRQVPHLHGILGMPLRSEGRTYGTLFALHSRPGFFGLDHERRVEVVAALAGAALARAFAFDEAQRLAITDALTGLYNVRYFTTRLEAEIQRAQRYGHELALLIVDSDALKRVNDQLGHAAGNELLVELARTIRQHVRATDLVARFGGDEFVVLQPETSVDPAATTAERIREAAYTASNVAGVERSVSVGVATYPASAADADSLFRQADAALYRAKNEGKNRVAVA